MDLFTYVLSFVNLGSADLLDTHGYDANVIEKVKQLFLSPVTKKMRWLQNSLLAQESDPAKVDEAALRKSVEDFLEEWFAPDDADIDGRDIMRATVAESRLRLLATTSLYAEAAGTPGNSGPVPEDLAALSNAQAISTATTSAVTVTPATLSRKDEKRTKSAERQRQHRQRVKIASTQVGRINAAHQKLTEGLLSFALPPGAMDLINVFHTNVVNIVSTQQASAVSPAVSPMSLSPSQPVKHGVLSGIHKHSFPERAKRMKREISTPTGAAYALQTVSTNKKFTSPLRRVAQDELALCCTLSFLFSFSFSFSLFK